MRIFDILSMTVRNLFRRKLRSVLTVLGVVVGTSSIVLMLSLGVAVNKSQEEMMQSFGDLTMIDVYNYNYTGDDSSVVLDDATVRLMNEHPHISVATPFWSVPVQVQMYSGRDNRYMMRWMDLYGVYPEALREFGYDLAEGIYLDEATVDYPMVVGQYAFYNFEDTKSRRNPSRWVEMDEEGNITNQPFVIPGKDKITMELIAQKSGVRNTAVEPKVVGTLVTDWGKGWETAYGVYMRIDDLKRLLAAYDKANNIKDRNDTYNNIRVKADNVNNVEAVEKYIHDLGFPDTWSLSSMREQMQDQTRQIQMFLGGLGAVSLLVAAIGIANTMIMSIYERTREIGVMKVLGCFLGNIRSIFLLESGLIGFFGGVVGVAFSYGISKLLNYSSSAGGKLGEIISRIMGGWSGNGSEISIIPPWLVILALAFGTSVGLVSGIMPAFRAVRISALEAIKHD